MKKLKVMFRIVRETWADRIIAGFLAFMFLCALVIWLWEEGISSFREALWYCFTVASTIGFGDVVVQRPLSKILTVILSVYALVTLAIFTGVIVNYYTHIVELHRKESLDVVMDKLERLPELSKEELEELSEKIRKMRP